MMLGKAILLILFTIIVLPFSFQGVLCETPPIHENFEEAEYDLETLLSFLEESKLLSESVLEYFVNMEYTKYNFSVAIAKAKDFHLSLQEAEMLLKNMNGEATSYYYLEEYLIPFLNLDQNITSLIVYYSYFSENISIVEDYHNDSFSSDITVDSALQSLNQTEFNIEFVKNKINGIELNTELIKQNGFSTSNLEELIMETKQLIESEENATKELAELFDRIPNYLSFYIHKTDLTLGEELKTEGYFFADSDFKYGQNITLVIDGQTQDSIITNETGRYEFKKDIPLNHSLGVLGLYAVTFFNGTQYLSNTIYITINKPTTKLTLTTNFHAYSPNQTISFSGRLIDNKESGLIDKNVTLYFNNKILENLSTNIDGYYSYDLDTKNVPIGIYNAHAKFDFDEVYLGSDSQIINIPINLPSKLTLSILETVIYEGQNITFSGELINEYNNIFLSGMIIEIYIENEKVGEVVTNNMGRYKFNYFTLGMAVGNYSVHSEFNPFEVKWREAKTDTIIVEIINSEELIIQDESILEKIYDNLILILFLILVFLLPIVFYINNKRRTQSPILQSRRLRLIRKSYPKGISTEKLLNEIKDVDNKLKSLKEKMTFKEKIVFGYHTLLDILEKNNIIKLKSSYTHIDIQQKLIKEGFPQSEIQSITRIFEKAMYSNSSIERDNLDNFIVSVRKMFAKRRRVR